MNPDEFGKFMQNIFGQPAKSQVGPTIQNEQNDLKKRVAAIGPVNEVQSPNQLMMKDIMKRNQVAGKFAKSKTEEAMGAIPGVGELLMALQAGNKVTEGDYKGLRNDALGMGAGMVAGTLGQKAVKGIGSLADNPRLAALFNKVTRDPEILKSQIKDFFRNSPAHPLEGSGIGEIPVQHGSPRLWQEPDALANLSKGAGDQWQGVGEAGYWAGNKPNEISPVAEHYKTSGASLKPADIALGKSSADKNLLDGFLYRLIHNSGLGNITGRAAKLKDKVYLSQFDKTLDNADQRAAMVVAQRRKGHYSTDIDYGLAELEPKLKEAGISLKDLFSLRDNRNVFGPYVTADHPDLWDKVRKAGIKLPELEYLFGQMSSKKMTRNDMNFHANFIRSKPGFKAVRETLPSIYQGKFFANPDELYQMDKSIDSQPAKEKIEAALRTLGGKPWNRSTTAYGDNEELLRYGGFNTYNPQYLKNENPLTVAQIMKAAGVKGNTYLNEGSRQSDPFSLDVVKNPEAYNYVINDNKRLKLTDLLAAMFGTGLGAKVISKQDPAKKDPNKNKS